MQVKALNIDWKRVPPEVKPFVSQKQTFISSEKKYSVHALSIYMKVIFVLVVDDLNTPVFLPAWLFETISPDIPSGWICNLRTSDEVELIMGPEFLAKDLEAYNSMVDQESDQIERFWNWHRE